MHGFNHRSTTSEFDLHAHRAIFAVFGINARLREIGFKVRGNDFRIRPE